MADADGAPIDRYVVLEHLSEGGMGAIYVGKKLGAGGFEMEVVLKQLLPEFTQQSEFIDLFLREAKLSATLDHANIIHTIDLVTAGGEYFIVMEYLAGADLRSLLKKAKRRGKRFSPAAAIQVSRDVLSALAYAHVKRDFDGTPLNLIHRDVSPSNVLLSYNGEIKLTDFGIAKASTHHSLFYKVKGKVGYMSPEQAKSEPLDHRSDLYSLAVCLYEVLTGERLFVHAGLTTSAEEIYSQPVPLVSRKVPGLPTDLDAIMHKALAIDPNKRYQTAGEFQEALMRSAHRNGLQISATELAAELVIACGPTEQWRDDDDDEDFEVAPRAGTEVYNPADDEDNEDEAAAAALRSSAPRVRPRTEMSVMQEIEMTSLINIADLERESAKLSAELDSGPTLAPMRPAPAALKVAPTRSLRPAVEPPAPPPPRSPPSAPPGVPTPAAMPANVREASPMMRARADTPPPVAAAAQLAPARHARAASAPGELVTAASPPARRGFIRPWMVILAILLIGGVAAIVVGMSGPDLAPPHVAPSEPRSS